MINIGEMDYRMEEMINITWRMLGSEDQMVIFLWIAECISLNRQNTIWIIQGPRVVSQKINKSTLNFKGKSW